MASSQESPNSTENKFENLGKYLGLRNINARHITEIKQIEERYSLFYYFTILLF